MDAVSPDPVSRPTTGTLASVREALDAARTLSQLWGAIDDLAAQCGGAALTRVCVLHPEEIDHAWICEPRLEGEEAGDRESRCPFGEGPWRPWSTGIPDEFAPWLAHADHSPPDAAPSPPWPPGTALRRESGAGPVRLILPIGAPPPLPFSAPHPPGAFAARGEGQRGGHLATPLAFLVFSVQPPDEERLAPLLAALQRDLPAQVEHRLTAACAQFQSEVFHRLTALSRTFQSCRDEQTAVSAIVETLRRDFEFDVALLALVEGEIRLLRGHTVVPAGAALLGQIDFPLRTSHHPLATIASEGSPVHALWAEPDDPRLEPLGLTERVWQPVWLPLVAKGEPVGMVIAFNTVHRGELCSGRRRALELLANQSALALESLRTWGHFEHEAVRDALTGLYNRRHLDRVLEQEIRRYRRYGTPLALLMIDLNDFKAFNDEHGHLAGDAILRAASKLILDNIRATDVAARYGGDEFVILMPGATEEQARAATRRILTAVVQRNRHFQDRPDQQFSLTIGHHTATPDTADRVLEFADRRLFDRKSDGSRRRLLDQLVGRRGVPVGQHARMIFGLMKTLAMRDPGHVPHARRVMGYVVRMCQHLGLGPVESEEIATAAILHDLGKVIINTEILRRSGPLTEAERMLIRSHPVVAADMLAEMTFLDHPLRIIRHHHERWDGRTTGEDPGYPDGLMGETIPLGSRIIRIADCFDLLTAGTSTRAPVPIPEACAALRQEAGRSLDPNLVAKCLPLFESLSAPLDPDAVDYPTGL